MCAIFGTKNKELFDSLYELNHKRGGFAFSAAFKNKDGKIMTTRGREYIKPLVNAKYILAHDQAPTSSVRLYEFSTYSEDSQYGEGTREAHHKPRYVCHICSYIRVLWY